MPIAWALAASWGALLVAGCGGADDRGTVVDFWCMGSEGERVRPLIASFEDAHPDIQVRVQQIPWTAAHEKLLTAFAGDALPDVCQLGNTWLAEFAALGSLEDLTDRVAASDATDEADYFPGVWKGNVIDGRLRGLPWYVDTRLLFYRTDLLAAAGHDAPPRSWDEWLEVMRDVTKAAGGASRDERFAILLPTNEFEQPIILGFQTGSEMLKDGGRYGAFSDAEFRRAFEFYISIYRAGYAPTLPNTRISNVWQEFERGMFAMYITGPWNVQEFRNRMSPDMEGRWATAPLPGPDGEYPGASTAGGCSLVMFRASREKEAAWQLIEYLSERDQQVEMCLCTSNLPARTDAWEGAHLLKDPLYAAFHEQLTNVRPAPPVPEWEQIVTGELVKMAESVITGRMDADEGLKMLDRRVDQILEKRRWMLARVADAP